MIWRWRHIRRAGTGALCGVVFIVAGARAHEAVETLSRYFELLTTGNLESAQSMWTDAAIERSSRFGITYSGIPLKIDCSSPVVSRFSVMRDHLQPPAKHVTDLSDGYVRLRFSAVVAGEEVEHAYYAYFDGDYHWLTYAQDYYARDWGIVETEFFRIHSHPDAKRYLNRAALDEADRFVRRLTDSLEFNRSDLDVIGRRKIEYFLCDSEETVGDIGGKRAKGLVDLASNDIISSFFPHFHLVTRLLVNIRLQELPLGTHPLLRDGVAVYYGGRWGKAPTALIELGAFLLDENIVELDSLLTASDFENQASSDIAYPVAGLFTAFLLDELRARKYWDLYRSLSGTVDEIRALSDSTVQQKLTEAGRQPDWALFKQRFKQFVQRYTVSAAVVMPGGASRAKLIGRGDGFVVSGNSDWLVFEFSAASSDSPAGNLLFGSDDRLKDVPSAMFLEQYGSGRPNEPYRFGVRFDVREAGLYDYATNQLVAKYILGMAPSDRYFDADRNSITIGFRKSLLGDLVPSGEDCKLISLR